MTCYRAFSPPRPAHGTNKENTGVILAHKSKRYTTRSSRNTRNNAIMPLCCLVLVSAAACLSKLCTSHRILVSHDHFLYFLLVGADAIAPSSSTPNNRDGALALEQKIVVGIVAPRVQHEFYNEGLNLAIRDLNAQPPPLGYTVEVVNLTGLGETVS